MNVLVKKTIHMLLMFGIRLKWKGIRGGISYIAKRHDKFLLNSNEYSLVEENGSDGYKLEVDLEYPDKLHELDNDYPLAPKNLKLVVKLL